MPFSSYDLSDLFKRLSCFFNKKFKARRPIFDSPNGVPYFLEEKIGIPEISASDSIIIIVISIVSFYTRFFNIHLPGTSVFDEYYFGDFISRYITGHYFHDIHPPFSKMIMALLSFLGGYDGSYSFKTQRDFEFSSSTYFHMRTIPAFFGSLCAPVSYIVMRLHAFSQLAAIVVAIQIISDTCMLTESHFFLTDSLLHFWTLLSLSSQPLLSNAVPLSKLWWLILSWEAASISFAVSTKWTSGGIWVFAMFFHLTDICSQFWKKIFSLDPQYIIQSSLRVIFTIFIPIGFVFLTCMIHAVPLKYHDAGTEWMPKPLHDQFHFENETFVPIRRLTGPSLADRARFNIYHMFHYSINESAIDPLASKFYEWPITTNHWLAYKREYNVRIFCFGQPFVWKAGFIWTVVATLYCVYAFLMGKMGSKLWRCCGFIAGYWASYLPFALIRRSIYVYHYIIPAMFSSMVTASFVDCFFEKKLSGFILCIIAFGGLFGYLLWSPFSYGIKVRDISTRMWDRNWDEEYSRKAMINPFADAYA